MIDYATPSEKTIARLLGLTEEFSWSRRRGLLYVFREPGSNICMVTARIPGKKDLVRELEQWCGALVQVIPGAQIHDAELGSIEEQTADVWDVVTIWFRLQRIGPARDYARH
jgi:hypothetical protein